AWMRFMRAALARISDYHEVALIGAGTATCPILLRGAERQNTARLVLHLPDPRQRTGTQTTPLHQLPSQDELRVDLLCDSHAPVDRAPAIPIELRNTPERDRATIAWADDILVLALRTGGNLHTLLRARLQKAGAHVLLADVPGLQSSRARTDLLELGAE